MRRQILAVAVGVLLSYLGAALGGYLLYESSNRLSLPVSEMARFFLSPCIAILVGACVGGLCESRPAILAALSLAPWALGVLFAQRQSAPHFLILISVVAMSLLLGIGAALLTFRSRTRPLRSKT